MQRSKWTHKNGTVAAARALGAGSACLPEGPVFPSGAPEWQADSAWSPGPRSPWLPLFARFPACCVLSTYLDPWLGIFPFRSCAICRCGRLALLGGLRGPDAWGWGAPEQRDEGSADDEAAGGVGEAGWEGTLFSGSLLAPSGNMGQG